jgi:hypothetical protein
VRGRFGGAAAVRSQDRGDRLEYRRQDRCSADDVNSFEISATGPRRMQPKTPHEAAASGGRLVSNKAE